MSSDVIFSIFRRDGDGYSSRGPIAPSMTLKDASAKLAELTRQFPNQQFVILGEIGTAKRSERVSVKLVAPEIAGPKSRKPKASVVSLVAMKEARR